MILFPVPGTPSLPTVPIFGFLIFPCPYPSRSPGSQDLSHYPTPQIPGTFSYSFHPSSNLVSLLLPSSVLTWVPLPYTLFPSNLHSFSSLSHSSRNHFLPSWTAPSYPPPSDPFRPHPQSLAHTLGCHSIGGTIPFPAPSICPMGGGHLDSPLRPCPHREPPTHIPCPLR